MTEIIDKTIGVDKIKKLIDLNKDYVNFKVEFTVISENKTPFYMIVVDQENLDSGDLLDYKYVDTGIISGSLQNDQNIYQNYFICLKSDEPCTCYVNIQLTKLEETFITPEQAGLVEGDKQIPPSTDSRDCTTIVGFCYKYKIIIALLIIVVFGLLYYYMSSDFLDMKPTDIYVKNTSFINDTVKNTSPARSVDIAETSSPGMNSLREKFKEYAKNN